MNNTLNVILIRVDASLSIGSGHLMRCRNLARVLRDRGATVVFICRYHHDAIHASLLDGEFMCLELPSVVKDESLDQVSVSFHEWLGCSEITDAEDSWNAIRSAGISRVSACVIDHYAIGADWECFIQERLHGVVLIALDDLANRPHMTRWLIDSSRPDIEAPVVYKNFVPDHCQVLTGANFALLSPDYSVLRSIVPARDKLRRILVFFGGVDELNYTGIALRALQYPEFDDLGVDVVLGSAAPHLEKIQAAVRSMPNVTIHVGLPSLSALMVRADLAIGAAGVTSWERACLGLPSIIIPVAQNQVDGARELDRLGASILLAHSGMSGLVEKIVSTLSCLLDSKKSLSEMSIAAFRLGDGRGVQRAATCLLGPDLPLRLRSTSKSDLWLYYWWANDSDVRSQSFNSSLLTCSEHQDWFQRCIDSVDVVMFVLVDRVGLPLGQIRFERQQDYCQRIKISFSIDRLVRGMGLGGKLLDLGLEGLSRLWGNKLHCFAQVKPDNIASAKIFLQHGFTELALHAMR